VIARVLRGVKWPCRDLLDGISGILGFYADNVSGRIRVCKAQKMGDGTVDLKRWTAYRQLNWDLVFSSVAVR